MKQTFKASSNVMLIVVLLLMVIGVWLDNVYVATASISISLVSIVVTVLSSDTFSLKNIFKELNLYFFIVSIIISLSVPLATKILLYIGIALFVLMIILYLIPLIDLSKEKQQNSNRKEKKK